MDENIFLTEFRRISLKILNPAHILYVNCLTLISTSLYLLYPYYFALRAFNCTYWKRLIETEKSKNLSYLLQKYLQ